MNTLSEELKTRFNTLIVGKLSGEDTGMLLDIIDEAVKEAEQETAQQCYLECLAVECGLGECGSAIATKFNLKNGFTSGEGEKSNKDIYGIEA